MVFAHAKRIANRKVLNATFLSSLSNSAGTLFCATVFMFLINGIKATKKMS